MGGLTSLGAHAKSCKVQKLEDEKILYSPTDLVNFLGCPYSTFLDVKNLFQTLEPRPEDPMLELLQTKGLEHEQQYLQQLKNQGLKCVEIPQGLELSDRVQQTQEAMRDGADVIYQAVLRKGSWRGDADFLIKTPRLAPDTSQRASQDVSQHTPDSSPHKSQAFVPPASQVASQPVSQRASQTLLQDLKQLPYSYEVVDTKLSRHAEAKHIIQLCAYSDMLAQPRPEQQPPHIEQVEYAAPKQSSPKQATPKQAPLERARPEQVRRVEQASPEQASSEQATIEQARPQYAQSSYQANQNFNANASLLPRRMHLVLGNKQQQSFLCSDYFYYYLHAKKSFEAYIYNILKSSRLTLASKTKVKIADAFKFSEPEPRGHKSQQDVFERQCVNRLETKPHTNKSSQDRLKGNDVNRLKAEPRDHKSQQDVLEIRAFSLPEAVPCAHCKLCKWQNICQAHWQQTEHLSLVANIRRSQTKKINAAGIKKLSELAAKPANTKIPDLNPQTWSRLHQQASLQQHKINSGQNKYEFVAHPPGKGFDRLPPPNEGDLFFDIEGHPLYQETPALVDTQRQAASQLSADDQTIHGNKTSKFKQASSQLSADDQIAQPTQPVQPAQPAQSHDQLPHSGLEYLLGLYYFKNQSQVSTSVNQRSAAQADATQADAAQADAAQADAAQADAAQAGAAQADAAQAGAPQADAAQAGAPQADATQASAAPVFKALWAHNYKEEKQAFKKLMYFFSQRMKQHPQAHIYHYNHYEVTALKRLAGRYAVCEQELDDLLRAHKFVDLYTVVREAVRTSEPQYSLKNIEKFFIPATQASSDQLRANDMGAEGGGVEAEGGKNGSVEKGVQININNKLREGDVATAVDSLVVYNNWQQLGDPKLLQELEAYNKQDCVSTYELQKWLLKLKTEYQQQNRKQQDANTHSRGTQRMANEVLTEKEQAKKEEKEQREHEYRKIRQQLEQLTQQNNPLASGKTFVDQDDAGGVDADYVNTALVAQRLLDILDFHVREQKPQWWAHFDRQTKFEDELIDDPECLGGLQKLDGPEPFKRSFLYTYSFPTQDHKIRAGQQATIISGGSDEGKASASQEHKIQAGQRAATISGAGDKGQSKLKSIGLMSGNTKAHQLAATQEGAMLVNGDMPEVQVVELDDNTHTLQIKCGPKVGTLPDRLSIGPGHPIQSDGLRDALYDYARQFLKQPQKLDVATEILANKLPRQRASAHTESSTSTRKTCDITKHHNKVNNTPDKATRKTCDAARQHDQAENEFDKTTHKTCDAERQHDKTSKATADESLHTARGAARPLQRILNLEKSYFFIQGPPGTGKTHTSADIIVELIRREKKIGVSSNSHKAINNLLHKIEELAIKKNINFCGVKKTSPRNPDSQFKSANQNSNQNQNQNKNQGANQNSRSSQHQASDSSSSQCQDSNSMIVNASQEKEIDWGSDLFAGTAWFFTGKSFDAQLDYLFIDEAGQVSTANVLAMSRVAHNIVLVGDQMQLGQPTQGTHPGRGGLSVLEFLFGSSTVSPARGFFLNQSYRMHPSLCRFVSDAFYAGKLKSHPSASKRHLQFKPNSKEGAQAVSQEGAQAVSQEGVPAVSQEGVPAVSQEGVQAVSQEGLRSALKEGVQILPPKGLVVAPVESKDGVQKNYHEAQIIQIYYQYLLGQNFVDSSTLKNKAGQHSMAQGHGMDQAYNAIHKSSHKGRTLGLDDILVVTPYNVQLNYLQSILPAGARVGTVDKFQGQQAAVVLVSMVTSSIEEIPRGMEFLYSPQRLNVAISRAQCLAVVVLSPQLLTAPCSKTEHLKQVNTFCWLAEYAKG